MKKSYMKPEVNGIEVAANQAVAACAISKYDMVVSYRGWQHAYSRGRYGTHYTDEELEAAKEQWASWGWDPNAIFRAYDIKTSDGQYVFNWEDLNNNGVWEKDGVDNWQDVENADIKDALFAS